PNVDNLAETPRLFCASTGPVVPIHVVSQRCPPAAIPIFQRISRTQQAFFHIPQKLSTCTDSLSTGDRSLLTVSQPGVVGAVTTCAGLGIRLGRPIRAAHDGPRCEPFLLQYPMGRGGRRRHTGTSIADSRHGSTT